MACWYVASHLNLDSSLSSSPSPIPRLFSTLSDFTAFAPLPRWRRTAFDASTHLRARGRPLFSKRFPSRRGGPNASYNLGREFEKYTCQRSRGFPLSNLNLLSGHDERHLRIVIKRNSIPSELYPENFTFLQFNSRRWKRELYYRYSDCRMDELTDISRPSLHSSSPANKFRERIRKLRRLLERRGS